MRLAAEALKPFVDSETPPPPPPAELMRRIMSFVAGQEIEPSYAAFMQDEMAIDGTSSKDPSWPPELKPAARRLKVLVIGAGMSGLLAGVRLKQAGVPFEIVDKNPDVGGTWLENTYPGCRVDSSNHIYSYSFEQNVWQKHFSPQPVLLDISAAWRSGMACARTSASTPRCWSRFGMRRGACGA